MCSHGWFDEQDFHIKQTSHKDWVISIVGREEHGHFKTYDGCIVLRDLIIEKELPNDPYFREAAHRILLDDEYAQLTPKNVQPNYNNCRIRKGKQRHDNRNRCYHK